MINSIHFLDNIKYDSETNSMHSGAIVYGFGSILALIAFPDNSKHGVGGLVEYERDPVTKKWNIKEHVITSKYNGIANSIRVGDTLIGGSYLTTGILLCKLDKNGV